MFRLSRVAFLVSLSLLSLSAASSVEDPAAAARAQAMLARLPLRFEANRGQQASGVRYSAHAGGYSLLLTDRGPSFVSGAGRIDVSLELANRTPEIQPL